MKTNKTILVVWLVCISHTFAQNLVTNPGFEAGNTGFTTDYTLLNAPQIPAAGSYYITNTPYNAFPSWNSSNSWVNSGDHTTGSGQMMIVDGSSSANSVFWRQNVLVTTNSSYIFSAWTLRFDSVTSITPTQYFAINLSRVGPVFPLLAPPSGPSGWQGHGVTWNSGTSTVATLELRLQTGQAGAGNNLAVDDVAFLKSSDLPPLQVSIFITNNAVRLGWFSYPGPAYQPQWTTNINTNSWFDLGSPIVGTGITNYVTDAFQSDQRFYRVVRSD